MIAVLCVAGSTLLVGPINHRRTDLQIVPESRYGDTPKYVLLAASMGTFRGLVVDFLWYRADKLQNEGKLFEANTLADWITTLQPRFGQVWVFQSWNMAYNISVLTHTPEERWDWVSKGIRLLRDQGIVYNPKNIAIYRQLGWTFLHKIGQRADDMNQYYKARLAQEWQELLGALAEGATKQASLDRFKPIADAADEYFTQDPNETNPRDPFSLLYEEHPETRGLVKRLREIGYDVDQTCLRIYGRIVMYGRYADPRELIGANGPLLDERGGKFYDLIQDPTYKDVWEKYLLPFLRAKVLIEDYHMEPARMYRLMERYGPMDWRHPGSHNIYWAATGIEKAGELHEKTKYDVLNTDRQIISGLQMLMHSGTITFDPMTLRIDTVPDPRFIDAYGDAMIEANNRQQNIEWLGQGNQKTFEQGHENFLRSAVLYAYLYGDINKAQEYYKQLRDLYGQKPYNVFNGVSRYTMPLSDLVATEIGYNWGMTDQVTRPMLESLLISAFQRGLANARYDVFERFIDTAKRINDKLFESRGYNNPTAQTGKSRLIDWNNFDELLGNTYVKYLRSPNNDLFERSQVYRNSPSNFQATAYAKIIDAVRQQAQAQGWGDSVDRLFPAPPEEASQKQKPELPTPENMAREGQSTIERK